MPFFVDDTHLLTYPHFPTLQCWHHVANVREVHLRLTEEAIVEPEEDGVGRRSQGFRWLVLKRGHARIFAFLIALSIIDMRILQESVQSLLGKHWPSVNILFAFEAAILLTTAWSHMLLWSLHMVDSIVLVVLHRYRPLTNWWKQHKATLQFAVELQAQAVNFVFYCTFFALVMSFYGTPISLFRQVYLSFTRLKERLGAFIKYRRLMASMDRFETVTPEELEQENDECIICREPLDEAAECKRLPGCGHVFHTACLREWLVQQQTCPTCRSDIAAMEARERSAAGQTETTGDAAEEQAMEDAISSANEPSVPSPFRLYKTTESAIVWSADSSNKRAIRRLDPFVVVVGQEFRDGDDDLRTKIRIPDGVMFTQNLQELQAIIPRPEDEDQTQSGDNE